MYCLQGFTFPLNVPHVENDLDYKKKKISIHYSPVFLDALPGTELRVNLPSLVAFEFPYDRTMLHKYTGEMRKVSEKFKNTHRQRVADDRAMDQKQIPGAEAEGKLFTVDR